MRFEDKVHFNYCTMFTDGRKDNSLTFSDEDIRHPDKYALRFIDEIGKRGIVVPEKSRVKIVNFPFQNPNDGSKVPLGTVFPKECGERTESYFLEADERHLKLTLEYHLMFFDFKGRTNPRGATCEILFVGESGQLTKYGDGNGLTNMIREALRLSLPEDPIMTCFANLPQTQGPE